MTNSPTKIDTNSEILAYHFDHTLRKMILTSKNSYIWLYLCDLKIFSKAFFKFYPTKVHTQFSWNFWIISYQMSCPEFWKIFIYLQETARSSSHSDIFESQFFETILWWLKLSFNRFIFEWRVLLLLFLFFFFLDSGLTPGRAWNDKKLRFSIQISRFVWFRNIITF